MDDYYEIYEFRFVDKKTKDRCKIHARKEETALKIIKMWNDLGVYNLVKAKHKYMQKGLSLISVPPYVVEQEEFRVLKEWKEKGETKSE